MKHYYILTVLLLTACGGGSSPIALQTLELTATPPVSSSPWLTGKAIDGYIDGGNVFIDFNWNLVQDDGEPSAVTDSEGTYIFNDQDFSAIDNVTVQCARSRPVIVNVPVGATDTTRGYIDTEFTMYLIPTSVGNDVLTSMPNRTNISPFTGLFLEYINEAKSAYNNITIDVASGCGADAEQIASYVFSKTSSFETLLYTNYGINFDDLYSDFILGNNTEWTGIAESLVDFLQGANGLRDNITSEIESLIGEDVFPQLYISDSALGTILSDAATTALPFNMSSHFTGADISGWSNQYIIMTSELNLNKDGTIASGVAATFNNVKQYSDHFNSYIGGVSSTAVMDYTTSYKMREEIISGVCANDSALKYSQTVDGVLTEYNISHHIGQVYEEYCVIADLPTNVVIEKMQRNGNDDYSYAISVDPTVSSIVPNVPLSYSSIDYNTTLYTIQGVIQDYDSAESYQSSLQSNEFISISRSLKYSDGTETTKLYFVYPTYTQCIHRTYDGTEWTTVDSGTENAYNNCREFITNFNGE